MGAGPSRAFGDGTTPARQTFKGGTSAPEDTESGTLATMGLKDRTSATMDLQDRQLRQRGLFSSPKILRSLPYSLDSHGTCYSFLLSYFFLLGPECLSYTGDTIIF